MATIDLAHVQRFRDRHGKVRHYFRKPGCKRVALPGEPGSAEFMAAYADAGEPRASVGNAPASGTVSAMIAGYYQSDEWANLKPQTQANYRNILERFRAKHGDKRAALVEPKHLKAILDGMSATPGAARNLLKRLRGAFAYGLSVGLVKSDPTLGVKLANRKTEGFRAWTDADIARFETRWPEGSRARLALALLLYTGQRRSDVVRMGRQHLRPSGHLYVKQKKTGRELLIPVHATLKAALDALPKDNLTFLMTAYGKPMTEAGFTQWFVECAKGAGLPDRSGPHGLRKAAGRKLAEAGCSSMEIASITGHESLKEVERYTKSAAQARLADAAMQRLGNS